MTSPLTRAELRAAMRRHIWLVACIALAAIAAIAVVVWAIAR